MPTTQGASLPNITGAVNLLDQSKIRGFTGFEGAFKSNGKSIGGDWGTYGTATPSGFVFDASLANEIYGKSDKVLPEHFTLIAQIKY